MTNQELEARQHDVAGMLREHASDTRNTADACLWMRRAADLIDASAKSLRMLSDAYINGADGDEVAP